jgi:hypothetical protein
MNIFILISISYDEKKDRISTKTVRGLYYDIQKAIDSIIEYPDSISEAGYFNYLLIEEREINTLDASTINEFWFQFVNMGADELLVEAIAKPLPFLSFSNFV